MTKKKGSDNLQKSIEYIFSQIESDLNLPLNFINQLLKDDDWSLVIKLHALIESSITSVLTKNYPQEALSDFIPKLSLHGPRGKVLLARKSDIITDEHSLFINKLSKLRNRLVHNISNVNYSIAEYYKSEQLSDIINRSIDSTSFFINNKIEKNLKVEHLYPNPKDNLLLASIILMVHIYGRANSNKIVINFKQ